MTSSTENRLVLLLWLYTILCCCLLLLLMLLRTIIFKATIINEETGYEKKQKKNIQLHSITFHILMWKIERLEKRCTNLHTKIYLKCKQVVCVWFYIRRTDQCCASKIHKGLEKKIQCQCILNEEIEKKQRNLKKSFFFLPNRLDLMYAFFALIFNLSVRFTWDATVLVIRCFTSDEYHTRVCVYVSAYKCVCVWGSESDDFFSSV